MKKSNLFQTFLNAFKGLFLVLKTERNFQIEVVALIVNVILIFYFRLNGFEASIILIVCFAVLVAELFNTAIEKFADFAEPNFNKEIGIIKDISASAVLVSAIGALIVGIFIYIPHVVSLFNLLK